MATSHPPLDDPHDTGQILYSSLLILGLNASSLEHNLRTPVSQKMFMQMNKKLGEAVLHFLFTCIDREKASKVFRDCWPIVDKKQESQFHKATFEWYKALQQGYGQPIPTAVAKTFLSPGGPKFTSALMTLTIVALHSSIEKKVPEYTLLHFPTLSRNPNQNHCRLRILQAAKKYHQEEFTAKQRTRREILLKLQEKAKSLINKYRSLCAEEERLKQQLKVAVQSDKRLTPQHNNKYMNIPLSQFQEEILSNISNLNCNAGELWSKVKKFQDVEFSSWKVMAPLLEGTTSLSQLDGALYSPTVPEIVYKDHASLVSKMGLQGLYTDGKLNLLNLVQYSTLALHTLLNTVRNSNSFTRPGFTEELQVQAGRTSSMGESMNELSSKLNILLPALIDSVSALRMRSTSSVTSLDNLDLEGKLHLCPPTPPLSLVNTPVGIHPKNKMVPLQLTPGFLVNKTKAIHNASCVTPGRLLSSVNMARAARRSPKADVVFSSTTDLDDSVIIDTSDETERLEKEAGLTMEMVTVDCRGSYQLKNEQKNRALFADAHKPSGSRKGLKSSALRPSRIPKHNWKTLGTAKAVPETPNKDKRPSFTNSESSDESKDIEDDLPKSKDGEDSFINRLADMLATGEGDDSGALELMTTMSSAETTVIEASAGDSAGCAEGNSDSETLMEAIEKIDITPKDDRKKRQDSLSLRRTIGSAKSHSIARKSLISSLNKPNSYTPVKPISMQDTSLQCARLIDLTPCHPTNQLPKMSGGMSCEDPFKTPMPVQHPKEPAATPCEDLKGEREVSAMLPNKRSSNDDLLSKMAFLTQSPVIENPTPLASKILSKFEGIKFGRNSSCTKTSSVTTEDNAHFGATVEMLRHQSKTNLNKLMEQAQLVKLEFPNKVKNMKQRRKTVAGSNSKFLSFVENLENVKEPACPIAESKVSDNVDVKKKNHQNQSHANISLVSKSDLGPNNDDDFQSSIARLERLLGDDVDATPTNDRIVGKACPSSYEENEFFMNSKEFEKTLLESPNDRRSSYLPRDSIFDTLTESILAGEVSSSLLTNENVKEEVRRESISSRRQSLISLGRMSISSNKGLSDALTIFQSRMSIDSGGILDVSDSCLLSTSMEDFGVF